MGVCPLCPSWKTVREDFQISPIENEADGNVDAIGRNFPEVRLFDEASR